MATAMRTSRLSAAAQGRGARHPMMTRVVSQQQRSVRARVLVQELPMTSGSALGQVTELAPEEFNAWLDDAQISIVDFYTEWCGPCKMISPEVAKMAAEYPGVRFAKFNCMKDKKIASERNIKALPTFHVYRGGVKVDQFVGAKKAELRAWITKYAELF